MLRKGLVIYEPKGRAGEYAPLAVNLYKGCGHGCVYCYGPGATYLEPQEFIKATPRPDIIKRLTKDAPVAAAIYKGNDKRVLLCFTCDPYQPINDLHHLTRHAINILHDHGFNIAILTKGGKRAERDFDLLRPAVLTKEILKKALEIPSSKPLTKGELKALSQDTYISADAVKSIEIPKGLDEAQNEEIGIGGIGYDEFAVTLTFLDEQRSLEWEPMAAIPRERIESLRKAHDLGIRTWVSLEPVIAPIESLLIIQETHTFVDLFKVGKLNYAEKLPEPFRKQVENINWHNFAKDAITTLKQYGCQYYIKRDLREYL